MLGGELADNILGDIPVIVKTCRYQCPPPPKEKGN